MKPNAEVLLKRLAKQINCDETQLEFMLRNRPDRRTERKIAIPDPDKAKTA